MADYIIGLCTNPACDGQTLYRSTRPVEPTDKLSPELFAPAREGVPPPPESGTADCPFCGRKVVFTLEGSLLKHHEPNRPPVVSSPSRVVIEPIFETAEGETIVNMAAAPDGWTIIWTNKRIVRLKYDAS